MTAVEPRPAGVREQLVRQLTGLGGLEVRDGGADPGRGHAVRTLAETLEAATHAVAGHRRGPAG